MAYFVRERFELSIGIYISMKIKFFIKSERENGKNKLFLAKTKQKKN